MSVTEIAITGYRSIRKLRMPLRRLTVLVGGNGVGKTNLYRSLELLHASANGTLAEEIAREGGLGSVFWAGGKNLGQDGGFDAKYRSDGFRKGEDHRLKLAVRLAGLAVAGDRELDASYAIEIGFPIKALGSGFPAEAQVKSEILDVAGAKRPVALLERDGAALWLRDPEGRRYAADTVVLLNETALSGVRGGHDTIEAFRRELEQWRFFHGFQTHAESPLRRPSRAITSPLLNADGSNLGAVFATLRHIRQESDDLDEAIEAAFPGARLVVPMPGETATFAMVFPDTPKREFGPHELSDGTLQFLALMGALHSYRLPPFVALNEPEASLHPSLLPALAQTIAKAAERTQIWVVTHSIALADAIAEATGVLPRKVIRSDGATWIDGLSTIGTFDDD